MSAKGQMQYFFGLNAMKMQELEQAMILLLIGTCWHV
jgi:hypothetical protein